MFALIEIDIVHRAQQVVLWDVESLHSQNSIIHIATSTRRKWRANTTHFRRRSFENPISLNNFEYFAIYYS